MPPVVVQKKLREQFLKPITEFTEREASSAILLVGCAIVALLVANSPLGAGFTQFWQTKFTVLVGNVQISKAILLWINDGLMAVFFLLVGLEIKRELLVGELNSARKAALPVFAAIGGMVVPALIFAAINIGQPTIKGWGVPMATDIAFALGVMALLGDRVPFSLKIFLAAVAIVDDLGAVIVIALFYTAQIDWTLLGFGGVFLAILITIGRLGVRNPAVYVILGIGLWVCFLKSGVHATIAGVLLALTIPAKVRLRPAEFKNEIHNALAEFDKHCDPGEDVLMDEDSQAAVRAMETACERVQMPLQRVEHGLHPWVSWGIMPIFALANAGVAIGASGSLGQPEALGVILGLVLGKPIGIVFFSFLSVKLGMAALPEGVNWQHVAGMGMLAGIGFTMSLFIADLAFADANHLATTKLGILAASVIAGAGGAFWLSRAGSHQPALPTPAS
jgi:NhaA family Na+:H+ antiporter